MRHDGLEGGPLWDEHRWEDHLNEIERKSEKLRRFITSDPFGSKPRWMSLVEENENEDDAVEAYIEEELLLDEAYFPDELDELDEEEDEEADDLLQFGSQDEESWGVASDDDDEEDFEKGDEWKYLSDDYTLSDYGQIENLKVFTEARDFAAHVLRWAEGVPHPHRETALHEFIGECLRMSAKLAGGFSIGFEHDMLGGNIAYTKMALRAANRALDLLQSLKTRPAINRTRYMEMHRTLHEIRNDIGVYIQLLRERFRFGVE